MGTDTKIEWCEHTFNPWRGCAKVSAGCANCYAERGSKRYPKALGIWGADGTRVVASDAGWRQPLIWNRRAKRAGKVARVFCGSYCDVCEDRPDLTAARARLKEMIVGTASLEWLLLSKRPENYLDLFWNPTNPVWPGNVWAGTSIENANVLRRIESLALVPATIRFLSCEPLLGPIDLQPWRHLIQWVIVGGESGPDARPCDIEWIRDIVKQCREACVACFVKQLGSRAFGTADRITYRGAPKHGPDGFYRYLTHKKGGDPDEWPDDLRVRQFPKAK